MKKYLAFDVGGTSVKYAVVNEEGEVSSSNKFKTPDTLEKNVSRNRKCSS